MLLLLDGWNASSVSPTVHGVVHVACWAGLLWPALPADLAEGEGRVSVALVVAVKRLSSSGLVTAVFCCRLPVA
jgi:hypothetical protein